MFLSNIPKLSKAQSIYLDFVRAAAAMIVLIGHAAIMFLDDGNLRTWHLEGGAVLVFFMLSGFLISYSVFRKYHAPDYGFKEFFIDRFARIYCAFLPALFFVLLADTFTLRLPVPELSAERLTELTWITDLPKNSNVQTWFGNLFMLQDFPLFQVARRILHIDSPWFVDHFGSASPFWTISIEWWLYMAFGIISILWIRDGYKFKLWQIPVLGFVFVVPVYFFVGGTSNCLSIIWIMGVITCLLFSKLENILSALKITVSTSRWRLYCAVTFILSLTFMAARLVDIKLDSYDDIEFSELQFSLFLLMAVFSIFFLLRGIEKVPAFIQKFCEFIAGYSFSLYLTHATIISYIYLAFPGSDNRADIFWLSILLSNIFAIAFWWLFERHYRTFGAWLKKKTAKI